MNSCGAVLARDYRSGRAVQVRWNGGEISQLEPAVEQGPADLWVAPPLVDLQINGFAGVDFQRDDLSPNDLLHATRALRAAGCSRWLLTLITDRWPAMLGRLRHYQSLRAASPELTAAIAGWHLEGPFLSAAPGFCGAHDPECMVDPTPDHIRALRAVTNADPVLLTIAPERAGALDSIRLAAGLGISVSLGHTNASLDVLQRAVQSGATGFTHLGNACPQQLDRHDNILWRVFDTPGLTSSLIPDGIHVSPPLFRLAHRVLGSDRLYYTTDAVAAAGAPPGRYTVGRHQVDVGADRIVRQPGRTNYAGSGLRPVDGIMQAAAMLGWSWRQVWPLFSTHPARFMGLSQSLEIGAVADFCLVQENAGGTIEIRTPIAAEP